MISLKSFISAIQEAIINASDTLIDKNVGLFDKYFQEVNSENKEEETGNPKNKSVLEPKMVILEYPTLNANGEVEVSQVHVPLITLVPWQMPQIEKAVLTSDFLIEIVDDEIQLNFAKPKSTGGLFWKKKEQQERCKLEITLKTQETTEGIKLLVEGYEAILRRQIV